MDAIQVRVVTAALFFIVIFLSGMRLSRAGKPYGVLLFNAHKLIAVAAAVYLAIAVIRISRTAALDAPEILASAVTGLCFLGSIVTGGLVSIEKPMPAAILTVHRLTPIVTVLAAAALLYLLLWR
jgi:hypothetical protein